MIDAINIYCDESCHLCCDTDAMALGALAVPADQVYRHNLALRQIKKKMGVGAFCELKWTKVSPSGQEVYKVVIDYFFSQPDLAFRAVIIPDKGKLNHEAFTQTHDDWYYKMYYLLLQNLIDSQRKNMIYIDIKDTCGKKKVAKLHDVLCNNQYDFDRRIISRVQTIRSHEVELMSIVDVFVGALTYLHRRLQTSPAKLELINQVKTKTNLSLEKSTLLSEHKFNLFIWQPQEICR